MNEQMKAEGRWLLICVDAYPEKVLQGTLHSVAVGKKQEFRGLMQLCLCMEQLFDQSKIPQAGMELRSFGKAPEEKKLMHPAADINARGKLATFSVQVLFRQNASWQGVIRWVEGRTEQQFRSALEFALLMDSAIGTARPAEEAE